jgi:CBS domain containing-hemolysin-like protein
MSNFFKKIFNEEYRSKKQYDKNLNKIKKILQNMKTDDHQRLMISSMIEMKEFTARDIMIPRIDVSILKSNCTRTELNKFILNSTYSRIPVYEDTVDNIKGILHLKDIFSLFISNGTQKKLDLTKYLTEVYFVPESKKIIEILRDFQVKHLQFAVVVDEYGGFSGIVTMEDILEEIIGDIQDEFDEEQQSVKKLESNSYSIDARMDLQEFNETFNESLPESEVDTIGGFLIMHTGYIPKQNQIIKYQHFTFKILSKRRNSIIRIKMIIDEKKKKTA